MQAVGCGGYAWLIGPVSPSAAKLFGDLITSTLMLGLASGCVVMLLRLREGREQALLAAAAGGRVHLLFNEGAAERVFYGSCVTNCSNPASWSPVQLASTATLNLTAMGAQGIEVDGTGRLHALLSGVAPLGSSANEVVYATCASSCGVAASWTLLDITSVAISNSIGTVDTFMVAPSGAVSFVTGAGRYVACGSGCTNLASWSAGNVINGTPQYAARDGAGVTHVILFGGTTAMGDNLFFYARCAASCTQGASWQVSAVGFIYRTNNCESGFAVTPSGKLYLAYNQGITAGSTTDNRRLVVNSCQTPNNCLDLNTWTSFALGAIDEGDDGTWLEAIGEELGLATTSGLELNVRECTANCGAAAGWSAATAVDSNTAITQTIHPAAGSACPTSSQSAAWWPNSPTIAVSSAGIVIAHSPYAIVKCPASVNPSRLPPIGRFVTRF